jgi:hypothetical protein
MVLVYGMALCTVFVAAVLLVLMAETDAELVQSEVDFVAFENAYFPDVYKLSVEGDQVLVGEIPSNDMVYRENLQARCLELGFPSAQFNQLWMAIKATIFNPEGAFFAHNRRNYDHVPEVEEAERVNQQAACLPNAGEGDCLLLAPNEYSTARALFSRYSAEAILEMRTVVFIHSCSLPASTAPTAILEELLGEIASSGLMDAADAVFVVNVGLPIRPSLVASHPKVVFTQASADFARFEVPTLQVLHYFSRLSKALRQYVSSDEGHVRYRAQEYQLLYVHTKGVSGRDNPQIRDWRNFMTYFMVAHYRKCQALLRSDSADVLGVNLQKAPQYTWAPEPVQGDIWFFAGNFWWAQTDYLASLPALSVRRNTKYDGEFWIGSAVEARMLSMHDSATDSYNERYLPHEYVNSPFLASIAS